MSPWKTVLIRTIIFSRISCVIFITQYVCVHRCACACACACACVCVCVCVCGHACTCTQKHIPSNMGNGTHKEFEKVMEGHGWSWKVMVMVMDMVMDMGMSMSISMEQAHSHVCANLKTSTRLQVWFQPAFCFKPSHSQISASKTNWSLKTLPPPPQSWKLAWRLIIINIFQIWLCFVEKKFSDPPIMLDTEKNGHFRKRPLKSSDTPPEVKWG